MSAFKRNLVPLVCIAFVAASVATAIFYGVLGSRLREASADTPRQPIVVAAHSLDRGAIVTAADAAGAAAAPQAGLRVEHRPPRRQLDQERRQQEERGGQDESL